MSDYSFGTEGMWRFLAVMAMVGILTVVVGGVAGITWVVNHLRWVP